jgi:microcystin degradation protein MlrC
MSMALPRIAVAAFMHESNGFATGRTTLADFETGGLDFGPSIVRRWSEAHHEIGGFFEAAETFAFEPIPAVTAWAMPSGKVDRATYDHLIDRLLASLRGCGAVEGVLLALHGAMVVEGLEGSADARTTAAVRRLIGPDLPLIVTLDYHANIASELTDSADAIVVYQTYPHVDQRERGLRAGELMARSVRSGKRPKSFVQPLPMLVHLLAQNTNRDPVKALLAEARAAVDATPGLDELQFVAGFPYADTIATGATVVAVGETEALAKESAKAFARKVWSHRDVLTAQPPEPAQAVRRAAAEKKWPTVLADLGDNVGGGSAADSTVIAQEILVQNGPKFVVVLHDPEAVESCVKAGVGQNMSLEAGGKIDVNAPPLTVSGKVRLIHDGRYEEPEARHGGVRFHDQGLTAVIETDRGDTVICTSNRHAPFSLGQLTSLGIEPKRAEALIVKAAVAFRAAYEPIAASIIEVDSPGLTAANSARFEYRALRRPILPLDEVSDEFL